MPKQTRDTSLTPDEEKERFTDLERSRATRSTAPSPESPMPPSVTMAESKRSRRRKTTGNNDAETENSSTNPDPAFDTFVPDCGFVAGPYTGGPFSGDNPLEIAYTNNHVCGFVLADGSQCGIYIKTLIGLKEHLLAAHLIPAVPEGCEHFSTFVRLRKCSNGPKYAACIRRLGEYYVDGHHKTGPTASANNKHRNKYAVEGVKLVKSERERRDALEAERRHIQSESSGQGG